MEIKKSGKIKCPKCGTMIDPRAMMCIHCGLMYRRNKKGKLEFQGFAKRPTKVGEVERTKTTDENVRIIEADKKSEEAMEYASFGTGNLNRVETSSKTFIKKSSQGKDGMLFAKDVQISDALADLYMGDRGKKLLSLSLNIPACLFGPIWYLYRRKVFAALLYLTFFFLASFALSTFAPAIPVWILVVIFMVLNLLFGNMIYVKMVKLYLWFLQQTHRKMPADQFMNQVEIRGGTSVSYVFFGVLVFALALYAYIYFCHDSNFRLIYEFFL